MKKLLCAVLGAVIFMSVAVSAYAKWCGYGDVTCDGTINSSDALMVLMASTGAKTLTGDSKKAADVDGNGKINSSDALYILNYSVGIVKRFPVDKSDDSSGDPDIGHEIYG